MEKSEHEVKLYTEYRDGVPVAYRFGESFEAMRLFLEGGFPTPEEAIADYERRKARDVRVQQD